MSSARVGIRHRVLQLFELVMQRRRRGRCRRSSRRAPSGPTSPRRPAGSSRWSASSGPRPRRRRALPRRRSSGRAWSCRRRSGPTSPTFSPGLSWNEASTKRTCRPYCLLILVKETIVSGSPGEIDDRRVSNQNRNRRRAIHTRSRRLGALADTGRRVEGSRSGHVDRSRRAALEESLDVGGHSSVDAAALSSGAAMPRAGTPSE